MPIVSASSQGTIHNGRSLRLPSRQVDEVLVQRDQTLYPIAALFAPISRIVSAHCQVEPEGVEVGSSSPSAVEAG